MLLRLTLGAIWDCEKVGMKLGRDKRCSFPVFLFLVFIIEETLIITNYTPSHLQTHSSSLHSQKDECNMMR